MLFDWNPKKAESNFSDHGVSFEEATTVFGDPLSETYDDPDHSFDERRFIIIGMSEEGRLLFVAHADDGNIIRIISARELTKREQKMYEEGIE